MTETIKPNPLLLQFSAVWCAPCKAMAPVMSQIVTENATTLAFDKVDIDERPELAEAHNVRSIPTFAMFKNVAGDWVEVDRIVGARDTGAMKAWVEKTLAKASETTVSTETI